ncbi:MAG: type II toxin-antitoxin system YafO family toxin [Rhodoferax sp.]|nr:type II toxin-antitoxin system YafO family toxin [Rhodoferax sp.]
MAVQATQLLQNQFDQNPDDCSELLSAFKEWKAKGEYSSYLFGKDSAYIAPKVDGIPYALRHVHLAPIAQTDKLKKWNKAWKNKGRKTSDRVLVYVSNASEALLIYVLPEPDAHEIARMETPEDKHLMQSFAAIAAAFLDRGEVIA